MKNTLFFTVIFGLILTSACTTEKADSEKSARKNPESVEDGVRPAASGGSSAAYFTYSNPLNKADTLKWVEADFATIAQVHESYKTEDGLMGMREIEEVVIQPGEKIQFRQGGLHIMLMGLKQELNRGDSVVMRLSFARAGEVSQKLPVQP